MGRGSETAKGAAGGAASGAAMGSVAGPYGAAIGGAVGGIAGGIKGWMDSAPKKSAGNPEWSRINALTAGGFGDPDAGYWSQDVTRMKTSDVLAPTLQLGADQFRAGQLAQQQQLQNIASGQQAGAGELAVQRQIQNALAAQQGQARMARGGNAALAYRNAANQMAALGSTGAGLGQQAAMQDKQAVHAMLSQLNASGRQSDIGVANANAGYQMGASQANAANQLASNQMNSQNYLQLLAQLRNQSSGDQAAAIAQQQAAQQRSDALYGSILNAGGQAAALYAARQGQQAAAPGASLASPAQQQGIDTNDPTYRAMYSDERLKTNISDAGAEIDDMLDKALSRSWAYKDSKHGEGRWSGLMAQDLERSEAGRRIVRETPEGKAIDVNKALSTALAATARLNQRLRKLEGEAK